MTDSYFTDARRDDPRALSFEPYRGHRIWEGNDASDEGHAYEVVSHGSWLDTPADARAEIDRCMDEKAWVRCTPGETHYLVKPDIFDRFER